MATVRLLRMAGNPNLLWRASENRLLVIDHNLAFDAAFDETGFFETHVFREDADTLFGDLVRRAETSAAFAEALQRFDAAVESLPPAWHWIDSAQTLPVQVDLNAIKTRLSVRAGLDKRFSMTHAARYSIIRFLPYAETEEFANVGVAMFAPTARYFDFRLSNKWRRIGAFFDTLDRRVFAEGVRAFQEELARTRDMAGPIR